MRSQNNRKMRLDSGSRITFKPDPEIFEDTVYDYDTILARLREQAFLNAGLHIVLIDKRGEEEHTDDLCYEGGIRHFVEYLHQKKAQTALHPEVIYLSTVSGTSTAEVAMQYNDSYNEVIYSFANNIHTTEGGTHETGFKTGAYPRLQRLRPQVRHTQGRRQEPVRRGRPRRSYGRHKRQARGGRSSRGRRNQSSAIPRYVSSSTIWYTTSS
jgi:DNA gyrase/topoisomerase IV subunit B